VESTSSMCLSRRCRPTACRSLNRYGDGLRLLRKDWLTDVIARATYCSAAGDDRVNAVGLIGPFQTLTESWSPGLMHQPFVP